MRRVDPRTITTAEERGANFVHCPAQMFRASGNDPTVAAIPLVDPISNRSKIVGCYLECMTHSRYHLFDPTVIRPRPISNTDTVAHTQYLSHPTATASSL